MQNRDMVSRQSRQSRRTRRATSGRVLRLRSPSQRASQAMNSLIRRGPMTIVLVFSTTCPHCQTYMPLWRELERSKNRRANLVSMQASTYDKLPMANKKPVSSVPTVLFVNKSGDISEAKMPRNAEVMHNAVKNGVSEEVANMNGTEGTEKTESATFTNQIRTNSNIFETVPAPSRMITAAETLTPIVPGTRTRSNELEPFPGFTGTPVSEEIRQTGGSPWAAFVSAARQAGPAVALMGAYALSRSSGLGAPRRRRSTKRRSG